MAWYIAEQRDSSKKKKIIIYGRCFAGLDLTVKSSSWKYNWLAFSIPIWTFGPWRRELSTLTDKQIWWMGFEPIYVGAADRPRNVYTAQTASAEPTLYIDIEHVAIIIIVYSCLCNSCKSTLMSANAFLLRALEHSQKECLPSPKRRTGTSQFKTVEFNNG